MLAPLRSVDGALAFAWEGLAAGWLRLDQLRAHSIHAAGLYWLGFDAGIAAQAERVRQAEHDADRMAVFAMNTSERAAEINGRLDRALASCPAGVELHSPEYFEWALRAAIGGE